MRQLPTTIAAALQDQAMEPMTLAIVWAERGPEDRIITGHRWGGANDAASANDTSVTVVNGSLMLAAGNTTSLPPDNGLIGGVFQTVWKGHVTEVGQWVWA